MPGTVYNLKLSFLIIKSRNPLKPVELRDIYYLEAFMSLKDLKVQTGTTRDGDFETSE